MDMACFPGTHSLGRVRHHPGHGPTLHGDDDFLTALHPGEDLVGVLPELPHSYALHASSITAQ